uniref:MYB-CC type transcription factor LHEQLE-containing domain-containing protein n=1 Tax=Daucus carota subsp. sativus TaxID=79200 RepID=A0A175YHQ6_DAUCS
MYSAIHSLSEMDGDGEFHGSLDGSNVVVGGDPRLEGYLVGDILNLFTSRFNRSSAVKAGYQALKSQVIGPFEGALSLWPCRSRVEGESTAVCVSRHHMASRTQATPKTILRTMGVKGLTLYHLKSHLQKYRLGKQSCKELAENSKDASCIAESHDTDLSTSASSRIAAQNLNDGYHVTEALRVQMEVQKRLHEQLEVQHRLQLRIEAQGKYLQSILEKACKALNDQTLASVGLEAAREELSELAIKVANDCQQVMTVSSLSDVAATLERKNLTNMHARIGDCSVDSCLTTNESPVSPIGVRLQAGALKKRPRPRPISSDADLSPLQSSLPQMEWMMSDIS